MIVVAALAAAWLAARAFGALAGRIRQPAVLGELLAGVVLGSSVLGLVDPGHPAVRAASDAGVILLLFTIGVETDAASLFRVGGAATLVAVTGVILPMTAGYYAAIALGLGTTAALVCGAALCATSVGITARVLSDIGRLESAEGKVILGAAVIDDVIGLGILAAVASIISAKGAAASAGSFTIVGAFVAGLVVHRLPQRRTVERSAKMLGVVLIPLFFASVGAAVEIRALGDAKSLALGGALIACGIAGKLLAGFGAFRLDADKVLIGIGMVPRGEVGLIFAQAGLAAGAVSAGEYGALMLMVLVTTFVTPPALAWRSRHLSRSASRPPSS